MANPFADHANFASANWDGVDHYSFLGATDTDSYFGLLISYSGTVVAGDIAEATLINNGPDDVTVGISVNFAPVASVVVPASGTAGLTGPVMGDGDVLQLTTAALFDYSMDLDMYPEAPPVSVFWTDFIGCAET